MKKRITLTIISLFLANISLAAPTCTATGDCAAGCYKDPTKGCTECPKNSYTTQPNQTLCTFCGPYSTNNDGKTGCTCNPGYHTANQSQDHTENNSVACEANTYKITYNQNGAPAQPIPIGQEVQYNGNFTTKSSDTFKYPGHHFTHWEYNGKEFAPNQKYLYNYTTDITLYAQWSECPAGYYCPDGAAETKCPAGATSDAGADDITDCYMSGDTQICDQDGCIYLPPNTKIHAKQ